MHVSAKADCAVRALVELTALSARGGGVSGYVTVEHLPHRQELPVKFLETTVAELRKDGVVSSRRGVDGGYRLARSPAEISVADIVRAVDGPLAAVRGRPPEDIDDTGPATAMPQLWVALRSAAGVCSSL